MAGSRPRDEAARRTALAPGVSRLRLERNRKRSEVCLHQGKSSRNGPSALNNSTFLWKTTVFPNKKNTQRVAVPGLSSGSLPPVPGDPRTVRWEGVRAGARVPCGGPAGWASGASAHGRCCWVVRTGHTPACGGTLLRGLPAPAIPVCPARPSCLGSPGPRRGPSGPQGSVSHAGVPASGATTQPSRSQSSRLGPVTPGVRWCPAACRAPHSGSSALLVRTRTPDPGTARAQGSLSPTRQLAGAAPPEASLGAPLGVPLGAAVATRRPTLLSLGRKSKAKPNGKKPPAEEKKVYLEPEHAQSRITDCEFKELVVLPREIDLNEWLASNSAWPGAGRGGRPRAPARASGEQRAGAGAPGSSCAGSAAVRPAAPWPWGGRGSCRGRQLSPHPPCEPGRRAQGHTRSPALGAESHRALVL